MMRLALHWQILIGMVAGAAIGITCSIYLGHRISEVPKADLPPNWSRVTFDDNPDRICIELTAKDGTTQALLVDATRLGQDGVFATVSQLAEKEPKVALLFEQFGRSWARWIGEGAHRLGNLFLRLLRMVAIPLIVTSLISGVMGLGQASRLGRMFGHTVLYYVSTSMLAIITGLVMVNTISPGLGGDVHVATSVPPDVGSHLGEVLFRQLETMIPPNPVRALADGNFLSIICFSLAFAVFAILVGGRTTERLRDLFQDGFQVIMAMTMAIICLAPLGVFFLMLYATATQGA